MFMELERSKMFEQNQKYHTHNFQSCSFLDKELSCERKWTMVASLKPIQVTAFLGKFTSCTK